MSASPIARPQGNGSAEVVAAYRIVQDLFKPNPVRYWRELLGSGFLAWSSILVAILSASPWVMAVSGLIAVIFWYRSAAMIHELTHQRHDQIPGFKFAWNLLIGVPWLLPSVMYEGVHNNHHKKTTYGTASDPEYLPLAGRPWGIACYLGFSTVVFPALMARFLLGAPLSWFLPPLRRLLLRSASSYAINLNFRRTLSVGERRRLACWECAILAVWWPPLIGTGLGLLHWKWLAVWYAVFTLVLFVNRLRMLTAHRFELPGEPVSHLVQFADSVDTPDGWWAELWAPLGMRYHALHHLFPSLPFHNLRPAYERLVATLPGDSFYHGSKGSGLLSSLHGVVAGKSENLR